MLLNDLKEKYPTDKFNLGYVDTFYQKHFEDRRLLVDSVLEIGIYGGESILLWHDYFESAKIYGVDITRRPNRVEIASDRLVILDKMNAYTQRVIDLLQEKEPLGFDIIIDDGPHTLETMTFYVKNYLPLTRKGGLFILEDIIDLNWTPILEKEIQQVIATFFPKSKCIRYDMRGKQKTDRLLNRWNSGLDVLLVEVL